MPDSAQYIRSLGVTDPLRQPLLRAEIQALQLPSGSGGLGTTSGSLSTRLIGFHRRWRQLL